MDNLEQALKRLSSREDRIGYAKANGGIVQLRWNKATERYDLRILDASGAKPKVLDQFDCSRGNIARLMGKSDESEVIKHLQDQGMEAPIAETSFAELGKMLRDQVRGRRR